MKYPPFYDFPTIEAWLAACDAIDAADPTVQAETQARCERLALLWARHVEQMALADRLKARTDAALVEGVQA